MPQKTKEKRKESDRVQFYVTTDNMKAEVTIDPEYLTPDVLVQLTKLVMCWDEDAKQDVERWLYEHNNNT